MDEWSLKSFFSFNVFLQKTKRQWTESNDYYCSWIFLFEIYVFYFLIFFHSHFFMMFSYLKLFIFLKLFVQQQKKKQRKKETRIQMEFFLHQIVVWCQCLPFVSINFIVFWEFIDKQVQKWTIFGCWLECMASK